MSKKNLILGGILIVLIAMAYIYNGPFKNWQTNRNQLVNFLAGIDTEKINKVEITSGGQTVTLEKLIDKWKIAGTKDFYASSEDISLIFAQIKEAAAADMEVASENKDKKSEFSADEAGGILLKLMADNLEIASIIVGKVGSDYSSNYISRAGDDKTYQIKANLRNYLERSDWRDLVIFKADKEKINKIRFQYPRREFITEYKNDKWVATKPKSMDLSKEKVDEALNILPELTAVKIPEQDFKGTGLEKSSIIVQTTGEGVDNTIMVGNESKVDKGMYFAKRGNSDNIYLISQDIRDQLNKKIEDYK